MERRQSIADFVLPRSARPTPPTVPPFEELWPEALSPLTHPRPLGGQQHLTLPDAPTRIEPIQHDRVRDDRTDAIGTDGGEPLEPTGPTETGPTDVPPEVAAVEVAAVEVAAVEVAEPVATGRNDLRPVAAAPRATVTTLPTRTGPNAGRDDDDQPTAFPASVVDPRRVRLGDPRDARILGVRHEARHQAARTDPAGLHEMMKQLLEARGSDLHLTAGPADHPRARRPAPAARPPPDDGDRDRVADARHRRR